jgi:hypothetical protein
VALALLLVLLSSNVPFASLASTPTCTLSCCAGMLPHAAGSCMGGSCHAGFLTNDRHGHSAHAAPEAEVLCGLPRQLTAGVLASRLVLAVYADTPSESNSNTGVDAQGKGNPEQAQLAALSKPCQPDCGGCGSGFTNSNSRRNPSAIAHPAQPRPTSDLRFADAANHRVRRLTALVRQGSPRGPPQPFS